MSVNNIASLGTNSQTIFDDDPTLQDPDATGSEDKTLHCGDAVQQELAAAIIKNPNLLKLAAEQLPYKAFVDKGHKTAVKTAYRFYQQYGVVPTLAILEDAIRREHAESKSLTHFLGAVKTLCEYVPETLPEAFLADQIRDYAVAVKYKDALAQVSKDMGSGKFAVVPENIQKFRDSVDKIQKPLSKTLNWLTAGQVIEQAEAEPIRWVVDRWLMLRGLHMLAAASFAGKSQLIADWAISIATGTPFGGMTPTQTPVVILDCENHSSITAERIRGKIDDDYPFLRYLDQKQLSGCLPLKPESFRELIASFYEATGYDRCVCFADTLRSLFSIKEGDPDEVNGLLYPLQRVCQEMNVALVLLNHRPKNNADYAGHNAMMAALDFFMKYERDEGSYDGTLEMVGSRLRMPRPEFFTLDPQTLTLMSGTGKSADSIVDVIKDVLADGELSQGELIREVQSLAKGELGEKKLRDIIEKQVPSLLTKRIGEHNKHLYSLAVNRP